MDIRGTQKPLCCFDSKRNRFASISKDNRIKIFSISTNKLISEFIEPKHLTLSYTTISWTNDKYLVVGTNNGFLSVWDVAKGTLLDAWKEKTNCKKKMNE
jgi:WD40 repeat protein